MEYFQIKQKSLLPTHTIFFLVCFDFEVITFQMFRSEFVSRNIRNIFMHIHTGIERTVKRPSWAFFSLHASSAENKNTLVIKLAQQESHSQSLCWFSFVHIVSTQGRFLLSFPEPCPWSTYSFVYCQKELESQCASVLKVWVSLLFKSQCVGTEQSFHPLL